MKKIFSKEVIIGLIIIFALAILFIGIDFLKGVNVFKASNYYYVTYTDVNGLAVSAPVTVNGFKVGQVRDISYEYDNPGHIKVEISLDQQLQIPENTEAILSTDLLGTASIALQLGTSKTMHKVGDELDGKIPVGMMDAVSKDVLPAFTQIAGKIDTLLTNLNTLTGDPALLASVQRLDQITADLAQTTTSLNSMMRSLAPATNDIRKMTGNFANASDNINQLTGNLNNLPLDSLMNTLEATTQNLKALTEQLNDKNSSLGLLMNDPALYNNLNATVTSLDSLFIDIKKSPKRYINIKLL
jgi:phospholipid/cholesterol/gamma-HCH transport system substrate-binding protein